MASIHEKAKVKQVLIALHGTNEFTPQIMASCIERGVTRVNVNKLVLSHYNKYVGENTGKVPLTNLLEKGTALIQESCEAWMDHLKCSGKA